MTEGNVRLDTADPMDAKVIERFGEDAAVLWRRSWEVDPSNHDDLNGTPIRVWTSYAVVHGAGDGSAISFVTVSGTTPFLQLDVDRSVPVADVFAVAEEDSRARMQKP